MKNLGQASLVLSAAIMLSACADAAPKGPDNMGYDGTGIRFSVSPLTLDTLKDACYSFAVVNGSGELVVGRGPEAQAAHPLDISASSNAARSVCASQFGNGGGGDISYVAPCDGQTTPVDQTSHTVTLWIDALCTSPLATSPPTPMALGAELCTEMQAYVDPCPSGCDLQVTCVENADTPVTFNFTLMGQADQGFFDIAVNFESIFCAAKFDTCYPDDDGDGQDEPIELLFGGDDQRDWTGVFGFSCTTGADTDTTLMYGDIAVVCDDGTTFPIDPTGAEGNNEVTVDGTTLHYGIYRGLEGLQCDDPGTVEVETCGKSFWNLAFSLDDLNATGAVCTLAFSATATDGLDAFTGGLPTSLGVTYPYIDVSATLTGNECQNNALNDGGAVITAYHGTVAGSLPLEAMCYYSDGLVAAAVPGSNCDVDLVGLFVGVSDYQYFLDDLWTVAPWIISIEGEDQDAEGVAASVQVKPTTGGDPIVIGTNVIASAYSWERFLEFAYAVENPDNPALADVYLATAPLWQPTLLASGLTPNIWLSILPDGLVAIFSEYIEYDSANEPRSSGLLTLAYRNSANDWVTQALVANTSGAEAADKIGYESLRYANGTLFFLSDFYRIGCAGGVLNVAVRSGDVWDVTSPAPNQTGEIGSPNAAKRKVCQDSALSPDGMRYFFYQEGGFGGDYENKFLLQGPSWARTQIVLPAPYEAMRPQVDGFSADSNWVFPTAREAGDSFGFAVNAASVTEIVPLANDIRRNELGTVVFGYTDTNNLVVANRSGGTWTTTAVTTSGTPNTNDYVISQDASVVAYLDDALPDNTATLYVASGPTWASVAIASGVAMDVGIGLSRAGSAVSYMTDFDDSLYTGTLNVAWAANSWGSRVVDTDVYSEGWNAFSPDGSALVYYSDMDVDLWTFSLKWAGVLPGPTGAPVFLAPNMQYFVWGSDTHIVGLVYGNTMDSYTIPVPTAPAP